MTTQTNRSGDLLDRLRQQLDGALEDREDRLARMEILAAAMAAFSRPIPDYEPSFQHQRHLTASATVMRH